MAKKYRFIFSHLCDASRMTLKDYAKYPGQKDFSWYLGKKEIRLVLVRVFGKAKVTFLFY